MESLASLCASFNLTSSNSSHISSRRSANSKGSVSSSAGSVQRASGVVSSQYTNSCVLLGSSGNETVSVQMPEGSPKSTSAATRLRASSSRYPRLLRAQRAPWLQWLWEPTTYPWIPNHVAGSFGVQKLTSIQIRPVWCRGEEKQTAVRLSRGLRRSCPTRPLRCTPPCRRNSRRCSRPETPARETSRVGLRASTVPPKARHSCVGRRTRLVMVDILAIGDSASLPWIESAPGKDDGEIGLGCPLLAVQNAGPLVGDIIDAWYGAELCRYCR